MLMLFERQFSVRLKSCAFRMPLCLDMYIDLVRQILVFCFSNVNLCCQCALVTVDDLFYIRKAKRELANFFALINKLLILLLFFPCSYDLNSSEEERRKIRTEKRSAFQLHFILIPTLFSNLNIDFDPIILVYPFFLYKILLLILSIDRGISIDKFSNGIHPLKQILKAVVNINLTIKSLQLRAFCLLRSFSSAQVKHQQNRLKLYLFTRIRIIGLFPIWSHFTTVHSLKQFHTLNGGGREPVILVLN